MPLEVAGRRMTGCIQVRGRPGGRFESRGRNVESSLDLARFSPLEARASLNTVKMQIHRFARLADYGESASVPSKAPAFRRQLGLFDHGLRKTCGQSVA